MKNEWLLLFSAMKSDRTAWKHLTLLARGASLISNNESY